MRNEQSDFDATTRIQRLLNVLDEEDEEESETLLNDENFCSNDDNAWEISNGLAGIGFEEAVESEMSENLVIVNGINCAAHTLQLVVRGALALLSKVHANVIALASKVCKFFRTETTKNAVRNMGLGLRIPSMEMPTRWSNTYMMVRCLIMRKQSIF